MGKVIIKNIKKQVQKLRRQKGVSMLSLVMTIIVMLILVAVVFASSMGTVNEADYSKYVTNLSEVSAAFSEKSTAVKGEVTAGNDQKQMPQVYNYVAKNGKTSEDYLMPKVVPVYTIIKDERQIGMDLPEMEVESGTGIRVKAQYVSTKEGHVFVWPPYTYDDKLYITEKDTVDSKMQTHITVGNESFEIELDPVYGSIVDIKQEEIVPPVVEPNVPEVPEIPSEPEHTHTFSEEKRTTEYLNKAATCTTPASYFYKCTGCDAKGSTTYTYGSSLNHSFGSYSVDKSATCDETGLEKRTCSRCGASETRIIPKDSKNHGGEIISEVTKPASCKEAGVKTYKCNACNGTTKTESIDKTEHSYGAFTETTKATCIATGVKTRKCTVCGNTQTESIAKDANNHTGKTETKVTKEATCTSEGTKVTKCSDCGANISTVSIPETGHSYGSYSTTKAATCTEAGSRERSCTGCGKVQSEVIDALGHVDTTPADNACDRCGKIIKEVDGLGDIEVNNPDADINYDPDTGDTSGIVPPAEEPGTPPEIPEEDFPETIDVNYGNFKLNTTFTPGTYETVPYEETHTRSKYPVSYQNVVWSRWNITKDADGNITKVEPLEIELENIDEVYSEYIVYDFDTDEALEMEGVRGDSVELWTIYFEEEDSVDNIIYLAAYLKKTGQTSNCHIAKYDGTKYVAVNYDAEIAAVDTFTETYTITKTKQVQITAPSTSSEYVYVPVGTLKVEKGMTWAEWLASEYNITGETNLDIRTFDFTNVALTDVIDANKEYGFVVYELSGTWKFNDVVYYANRYNDDTYIDFVSNGIQYDCLMMEDWGVIDGFPYHLVYYNDEMTIACTWPIPDEDGTSEFSWNDENYRVIDFGSQPQEVSKEFYDWFTANATEEKYELSGKWQFYSEPYLPDKIYQKIEFQYLHISSGRYRPGSDITVDGINEMMYYSNSMIYDDGWVISDGALDFGTEPQKVTKEFYEWFTANAEEQRELSGVWMFNENLNITKDASTTNVWQEINFVSNGTEYDSIAPRWINYEVPHDCLDFGGKLLVWYGEEDMDEFGNLVPEWVEEAYRTVDFGSEPQFVSKEFYDWFTANATKGLITFTVSGKEYKAIAGMTWGEFMESEYAPTTDEARYFEVKSTYYVGYVNKNGGSWSNVHINTNSERAEWTSDTIVAGNAYILAADFGPYGGTHSGGSND